jgi:hypothetical protein
MDRATVERWRDALDKKGHDVVRKQLDLRPGHPGELVYNIVDEPPYPDRAFCEDWCRGAPPPPTAMSGTGAMVVIMTVLAVVFAFRAAMSFSTADPNWLTPNTGAFHPTQQSSTSSTPSIPIPSPAPMAGGGAATSDSALQNTASQNSSVINTIQQNSVMMPSCTSVSSAGNRATVQALKSCSKLGQPFLKQSNGPPS